MRPVLTASAATALDAAHAGNLWDPMVRAGHGVAAGVVESGAGGYGSRVVVLAGPGNNGGDGYVAAAVLRGRGAHVRVLALAPPRTEEARRAVALARSAGVSIESWTEPFSAADVVADVVVDAVFGVGFHGSLPAEVGAWTSTEAPVVSVDVPSGLDATTGTVEGACFRASTTVALHATKTGHWLERGPEMVGRLVVVDVGLDGGEVAFRVVERDDVDLPRRSRRDHKWSAGSVLVVGGDLGMTGAAVLAARSALAAGAGAVAISSRSESAAVYRAYPELLTFVDETGPDIVETARRFDTVVMGPGLEPKANRGLVDDVLSGSNATVVLDAGALAPGVEAAVARREASTILTPHAGEFTRLAGRPAGYGAAGELARRLKAVVLLKGFPSFVADGRMVEDGDGAVPSAVVSGGPELATIGTGDVLAGMIAAFAARGLDPARAAWSAADRHGRAGSGLARSGTVTADRLVDEVRRWVW